MSYFIKYNSFFGLFNHRLAVSVLMSQYLRSFCEREKKKKKKMLTFKCETFRIDLELVVAVSSLNTFSFCLQYGVQGAMNASLHISYLDHTAGKPQYYCQSISAGFNSYCGKSDLNLG